MLTRLREKCRDFHSSGNLKVIKQNLDSMRISRVDRGKFDGAIMQNVLYALEDPLRCLKMVRDALQPNGILVVSGPKEDKEYQKMLETLYHDYRPNQMVVVCQGEETVKWIPWAGGRGPVSNQPTAYVCKEGTCHPPVHSPCTL